MEILGFFSIRLARAVQALVAVLALACHGAFAADGAGALESGIEKQVRELAVAATQNAPAGVSRVDIEVGRLDPRLRLAPCQRIEPYLPPGSRLWGRARIGLRCTQGTTPWNVYLPITVRMFGQALVATSPLAVGAVITESDVTQAEVDLAEETSAVIAQPALAVGRTVARALNPGQSVRLVNLKNRQFFAAGDVVKVVALGSGFSVAGEGLALTPGVEGQPARVKTESGRVLTGMPAGERRVEMAL
jgi:flagellar basal body P-ring formation protein FlgA